MCAGVWRLLAAGGGGEEMEVMGIIGAVEEERRWRVHVGERRGGSGRAVLILLLILLLAEGMCTCTCGCLSLACPWCLRHRHSHRSHLILEAGTGT